MFLIFELSLLICKEQKYMDYNVLAEHVFAGEEKRLC